MGVPTAIAIYLTPSGSVLDARSMGNKQPTRRYAGRDDLLTRFSHVHRPSEGFHGRATAPLIFYAQYGEFS